MAAATFEEVVRRRFSCRGFLARSVPRETIERALSIAQCAPSWCNTQPWQVVVTEGEATDNFRRALLAEVDSHDNQAPLTDFPRPEGYSGVRLERRRACGWQLYGAVGIARGDRQASAQQARRNFELFDAPHVAIITSASELGVYGAVDCGVYLATFLYALDSVGLGAIPQAALANHSPFIRKYFDIPDDHRVLCGVSLGYRDDSHPANRFRTERAEITETTRWVSV